MIKSLSLIFLLLIGPAAARADVTVINQSPRTSVMAGLALRAQAELGKAAEFYQSRDCQDAAKKFQGSPGSLIVYATDNVAAAAVKDLDCAVPLVAEQIVVAAWQSFSLCRSPDWSTPLHQSPTLGMSGMHPHRKWIAEFNQQNSAAMAARIFQGSSATLRALLAREISWGFIATATARPAEQAGTIVCDYTTDPRDPKFLNRHYRHGLGDLRLQVLLLYNGPDAKSVRSRLNNADFVRYLENSGYTDIVFDVNGARLRQLDRDYLNLRSFY